MTEINIIMLILVFVIGLVIGSFLNVVGLRLLSQEDFIFKRSKCPKCQKKIAWYDNIPILSYILLRGKCRNCNSPISFQYPLAELITGILFVSTYYNWGFSLKTLFFLILISAFVVITITDLKEQVIFDLNSVPLIPLGLVYNFFNIGGGSQEAVKLLGFSFNEVFISAILGALLGAAFFEIFSRMGYLFSGEYAFGGGDTILGAALGAWFGWKALIVILLLSLIIQMIVGVPIILYNFYKSKEYQSLIAMGGLFLALLLSLLGRYFTYTGKFILSIFIIISAFIIGGIAVYAIFSRMRETRNYTFLPFGPPLIIAGLIVMFCSEKITVYLPF
ncbi:MAG TPA: prepilin peptidase [Candidatus Gastranaerophilales bacterium]|nr:prepilin peptidase [Candidatus Gastranaerophilales bacterium]